MEHYYRSSIILHFLLSLCIVLYTVGLPNDNCSMLEPSIYFEPSIAVRSMALPLFLSLSQSFYSHWQNIFLIYQKYDFSNNFSDLHLILCIDLPDRKRHSTGWTCDSTKWPSHESKFTLGKRKLEKKNLLSFALMEIACTTHTHSLTQHKLNRL